MKPPNPGTYDRPNYEDPDRKPDNSARGWIVGIAWLIAAIIFIVGVGTLFAHFT